MNPNGHLEAMEAAGINHDEVAGFDFRGGGWPGGMFVRKKDNTSTALHPGEAFGTVINVMFRLYGAERCYLCIDGLAEYADLSFGDFWAFDYPDEFSHLERCTLVSQRTAQGLAILQDAEKDGVIVNHLLPPDRVSRRTLSMVRGKRIRAGAFLAKRRNKKLAVPNYHFSVPVPSRKEQRKLISYRLLGLFRGPVGRKIILFILFSPLTSFLHSVNRKRLKLFAQYHDN
jgi:coenzyme F420 hydrogenase subunit beta